MYFFWKGSSSQGPHQTRLDPDLVDDTPAMSEPAPPVEAQQTVGSEETVAVPTDPAGLSKNALKKKAKEEEKARKAEERKRKEEEARLAREAATAIVRGHLLQCSAFHSALTLEDDRTLPMEAMVHFRFTSLRTRLQPPPSRNSRPFPRTMSGNQ